MHTFILGGQCSAVSERLRAFLHVRAGVNLRLYASLRPILSVAYAGYTRPSDLGHGANAPVAQTTVLTVDNPDTGV